MADELVGVGDILTKPEPGLTKAEEAEAKKFCKYLLATLKAREAGPGLAGEAAGLGGGHADPQNVHATTAAEVHQ